MPTTVPTQEEFDQLEALLEATGEDLRNYLNQLEARVDALEDDSPTPQPPGEPMWCGSCPRAGGSSLAAAQTVLDVWGRNGRVAIRQFATAFSEKLNYPAEAALVHMSWKPASVAAITDQAVRDAISPALSPGRRVRVEVWHELDKKVRDGVMTRSDVVARKNAFYAAVKRQGWGSQVQVVNTLTGWEADPDNTATHGDIRPWSEVDADLLGMDFDGILPKGNVYPDFSDELPNVMAFLQQAPVYSGWAIPEFGAQKASTDTEGTYRASWLTQQAALFRAHGAQYATLYEYQVNTSYPLTAPAEQAAWKAEIANDKPSVLPKAWLHRAPW